MQRPDLVPDAGAALRIEAGSRLVEEQQFRRIDHAGCEIEDSPLPAGIGFRLAVGEMDDPEPVDQLVDAPRRVGLAHAIELGMKHEVLAAGRNRLHAALLPDIADAFADFARLAREIEAGNHGFSARWQQQRTQYPHGCRLAGAVGSEQPENLAFSHVKIDPAHRLHGPAARLEHFAQHFGVDDGSRHGKSRSPIRKKVGRN